MSSRRTSQKGVPSPTTRSSRSRFKRSVEPATSSTSDQYLRSPNGVRTRVSTLRGWCPRPLDDGAKPEILPLTCTFADSGSGGNKVVAYAKKVESHTLPSGEDDSGSHYHRTDTTRG